MISRQSHRGSASGSAEAADVNLSAVDLTAAEVADLRALWCRAEIVRHLLTVATGQVGLDEALASLNALLRPYSGVEIAGIVVDDLDGATALGADAPSADEEVQIDVWREALSRGESDLPAVASGPLLLVAGVRGGRVIGLARVHPTARQVADDIVAALRTGLGEAIQRATWIERTRRW